MSDTTEAAPNDPSQVPAPPRPTAFLVGAPRCGTTALANFLGQHPEIFVPYVKEPHYFGSDLGTRRGFPTLESYLELFADAGDRIGLEGSTWYLFSERAAEEIHAFEPDASIIAMLRNPVDLVYSWHSHVVLLGLEPIEDFEEALAAESDRRAGRRVPDGTPVEKLLYRDIPRFSDQLQRYFDTFGRDRVHVILHDDFRRDNAGTFRAVAKFLDVDPTFRPEFQVTNANAAPRSRMLQGLVEHPNDGIRRIVRAVVPRRWRHEIRSAIRNVNAVATKRSPMPRTLRLRLTQEFEPEVRRTASLLDRNLDGWLGR